MKRARTAKKAVEQICGGTSRPDIAGDQFGIQFFDGGEAGPQFRLLSEDDGFWHAKFSASTFWLEDLARVVRIARFAHASEKRKAFRKVMTSLAKKIDAKGKIAKPKKAKR